MATPRVSILSTEFIHVPITAREAGVLIDPTDQTVEMAFITRETDPDEEDWRPADWETDDTVNPPRHSARCLVGPDGTGSVAIGSYRPWVRISGPSPELPVLKSAGPVQFF